MKQPDCLSTDNGVQQEAVSAVSVCTLVNHCLVYPWHCSLTIAPQYVLHSNNITPKHTSIWVDGRALKQYCSCSITKWTIDHIGVASYPTKVCYAGKDISRLVVKHTL